MKRHVTERFRRGRSLEQRDRHVVVANRHAVFKLKLRGQAQRALEPFRAAFWVTNRQSEMTDRSQGERNLHGGHFSRFGERGFEKFALTLKVAPQVGSDWFHWHPIGTQNSLCGPELERVGGQLVAEWV